MLVGFVYLERLPLGPSTPESCDIDLKAPTSKHGRPFRADLPLASTSKVYYNPTLLARSPSVEASIVTHVIPSSSRHAILSNITPYPVKMHKWQLVIVVSFPVRLSGTREDHDKVCPDDDYVNHLWCKRGLDRYFLLCRYNA